MSTQISSSENRFAIDPQVEAFPFRRELSLAPLIAFWDRATDARTVTAALARVVKEELRGAPALMEPIEDLAVLDRHRELVDTLMSRVFAPASWEQDFAAALVPFTLQVFYATPSFGRSLLGADGLLRGQVNLDERTAARVRVLSAYDVILQKYYGLELNLDYPIMVTTTEPESGLERHFRMQFDRRFLEVDHVGKLRSLTDTERQRLVANLADPDVLMELIPPGNFVFRGFAVFRALDVTDQEVLSSIKRDLIEKESIVSDTRFRSLQDKLRTLFKRPHLRLGLAAIQGEQVFMLNYGVHLEHRCLFADSVHRTVHDFAGSIYERAVTAGGPLVIEDLKSYTPRTCIEDAIIETGVRNVVVVPLHYQDQLIGTLELGSPHPSDLNTTNTLRLRDVVPLFSMAVKRSLEELNARVQAVIKERCTAIHPSVEWRFRRAVLDSIERRTGGGMEMEPIVFRDVYPLYGVSDIRGSSTHRNNAIQADLTAHLRLARDVVEAAREARPLPILDELVHRIHKHIGQIELGLNSGDEIGTIAFLREHVEPRFEHLAGFSPHVREKIQAYRAALEPRLGTVYRRRKEFEDSVTLINDTIASYLDAEEEMAQAMLPHYFEKQRTDGVDYGIYVGASLLESGGFDELYLRNLRLWQLLVTCGIARRADALRDRLRVSLETTHLILVQHAPLAISFRFDEKRFDVDGAYNVRYEVIKKRIDKAEVKGTRERITQPGKIAIVYAQSSEAAEYREYIDYLKAAGYLSGELEELELEELQGVQGLRALRVTVNLGAAEPGPRPALTPPTASAVGARGR